MEAAKINWQSIESVFVPDETYENINAPQWLDLSAALNHDEPSVDAWFCKPDCKHPKTAEDFLRSTPTSKLLKSVSVSKLIALGDWSRNREPYLKRRKPAQDGENQNPNLAPAANGREMNENRKLKSTLSTRDVFGGRELLGKISDLYNELKKMGTTTNQNQAKDDCDHIDANTNHKGIEQVEVVEEKKQKPKTLSRRGGGDEENNIPLSLDLKNGKGGELGIRTSPPTPQCFSATLKPRLKEREPFQEIQLRQVLLKQEEEEEDKTGVGGEKSNGKAAVAASALDVFWFFKPCANSAAEL